MLHYKKYLISKTDNFEPTQYPNVVSELKTLKKSLISSGIAYKEDILISYFRRRSVEADWISANADLSNLFNSGAFETIHLEALFECSEGNKDFQKQYENFLKKSLANSDPITIGY